MILRIVDRGAGIAEDDLERDLRALRAWLRRRRRAGGLGLAIAKGFVEANGGRIWAESRAGQGSTFVVALPVARAVPGRARERRARVLVVDDEPQILRALRPPCAAQATRSTSPRPARRPRRAPPCARPRP